MTETHNGPQDNKISKNSKQIKHQDTEAECVGKIFMALNVLSNKKAAA
jgi:hypothetical protein